MAEEQRTLWEKTKTNTKYGFDRVWQAADKLGAPVNKLSNKLGSEAFWPTTLDKESDKAARILRSFCKDGFYAEDKGTDPHAPKGKQRVIGKIPQSVIKKAKGLAIFTTMRSGLWISGAGGSGVVIARKEDGTWSEPSGILLHTAGLGALVGVDIYDCVLVLNSQKALDSFQKMRCTLGGELSAVAGPVGAGGVLDTEVHKRQAPIFTYMKSRGFYAGVQVDGTVMIERTDENARFYGEKISATDILAGKAKHPPVFGLRMLRETIKAAQGDTVNESLLPTGAPPADFQIEEPGHIPSVPDAGDPDPYGVLALEQEGIAIKDANTHEVAREEAFAFHPSEKSPIYHAYKKSINGETIPSRSVHSRSTTATQTDDLGQAREGSTMAFGTGLSSSPPPGDFGEEYEARQPPVTRGPPPALPPRQSTQLTEAAELPIQMEDNEPDEETNLDHGKAEPAEAKMDASREEETKEDDNEEDEFKDAEATVEKSEHEERGETNG